MKYKTVCYVFLKESKPFKDGIPITGITEVGVLIWLDSIDTSQLISYEEIDKIIVRSQSCQTGS